MTRVRKADAYAQDDQSKIIPACNVVGLKETDERRRRRRKKIAIQVWLDADPSNQPPHQALDPSSIADHGR